MPLIPLLLGLAPTVAEWILGDKTGKAVGKVASIAQDILGTSDADQIERAVAADPNLALQFKQAVIAAAAEEKRMELEAIKAQLADVASARSQTVELAKAGSAIAWGAPVVSVIIAVGFFVMLYLIIRREIPEGSRDLANIMLGSLGSSFTGVVAYWVGSSAGSAQKTAALAAVGRSG